MDQSITADRAPMSMRTAFADLASVPRLHTARGTAYVKLGKGAPLVLVHGVGLRLETWAPQIAHFAKSHTVIALDMPGHGQSAPLPIGSNLRDFVGWCGDTLDDLGLGQVNLVGHSMGALIAGGVAASQPDRLARVACLNGTYRRTPGARRAVMERAAAIWTDGVDADGPMERWFEGTDDRSFLRDTVYGLLAGVSPQAYATTYTAFATGDELYADAWRNIALPSLFLTGDGDPNSTPEMSAQMAAQAPKGKVVIIKGHRHMVNLTAPLQVNAAMETWLQTA